MSDNIIFVQLSCNHVFALDSIKSVCIEYYDDIYKLKVRSLYDIHTIREFVQGDQAQDELKQLLVRLDSLSRGMRNE
jgi:hypothetical protein